MVRDLTLVHPELRDIARNFPRLPYNRWSVRLVQWLTRLQPKQPIPDDVQVEQLYVPSRDADHTVRVLIYKPKALTAPTPALVWMHGGGLIIGRPEMNDDLMSGMVQELGIVVVSIDYRLAPQHPFPAPLDDCYAALTWVHANAQSLVIDPDRIAIGGESAGGGLAASLVQLALDRGEVRPIFQLLIYPMIDDCSAIRTDLPNMELMTWTQANNRFGWESYLQQTCGLESVPPYAVASRREDFTGFPPTWIGVGTLDLFYEEDVAYAQQLERHGVECELVIIPGAFHGFDQFDTQLNVVQEFRKSQIDALRRHLFASQ